MPTRGPPASTPGTRSNSSSSASSSSTSPRPAAHAEAGRVPERADVPAGGGRDGLAEGGIRPQGRQQRRPRQPAPRAAGGAGRDARAVPRPLLGRADLPAQGGGEAGRGDVRRVDHPAGARRARRSRSRSSKPSRSSGTRPRRSAASWRRRSRNSGSAWRRSGRRTRPSPTPTTTTRRRRASGSSTWTWHGRAGAGPAARPRVRSDRHAEALGRAGDRQGIRRLRALGRRRQAAGGGGGQADDRRPARGPAAGEAVRRLPGEDARPAAADLLHQRLHDLAVG